MREQTFLFAELCAFQRQHELYWHNETAFDIISVVLWIDVFGSRPTTNKVYSSPRPKHCSAVQFLSMQTVLQIVVCPTQLSISWIVFSDWTRHSSPHPIPPPLPLWIHPLLSAGGIESYILVGWSWHWVAVSWRGAEQWHGEGGAITNCETTTISNWTAQFIFSSLESDVNCIPKILS